MFKASLPSLAIIAGSLLLQACGTVPVEEAPAEPRVVPELTLNFPEQNVNCVEQTVMDFTPLERGFTALAQGEHIEAVQHFQRYQRLEKSPEAESIFLHSTHSSGVHPLLHELLQGMDAWSGW